jgi:hypothetical protein
MAAKSGGRGTMPAEPWMVQTTAEQFAKLARLRDAPAPAENAPCEIWHQVWRALTALVPREAVLALSAQRGKVGLALSGGGFRASFFHLGVSSGRSPRAAFNQVKRRVAVPLGNQNSNIVMVQSAENWCRRMRPTA